MKLILIAIVVLPLILAFSTPRAAPCSMVLSCICTGCKFLPTCAAYHFVEKQHQQPHIYRGDETKMFEPRNGSPRINVTSWVDAVAATEAQGREAGIVRKRKFWGEQGAASAEDPLDSGYFNETVFATASDILVEYDVVSCADYVHETGVWKRNMPDEIRLLDESFVPP